MLSDYLKTNSRSDHDSIENSIDLVKCASESESYLKLIKAFYGYYKPIEIIFDSYQNEFQNLGIDVKARHKLNLLTDDLKHLGLSQNDISNLPTCHNLTEIKDLSEAIGALYVLEGSTMGGQIIFRQLSKSGIVTNGDEKGRFFKAYGADTMKMWNDFKNSLNKIPEADNDVVLSKAKETFNTLEAWLTTSMQH